MIEPSDTVERITRLEVQYENLFGLAEETRNEMRELNRKLESGCPFGRAVHSQVVDIKERLKSLYEKADAHEHTLENWRGSKVVLVALALLILQAVIAVITKHL